MGKFFDLPHHIKWIFCLGVIAVFAGCEKLDPVEDPPSFILIDHYTFTTTSNQGFASERIEDVWVTVGNELIGVFPIPSKIPILGEGSTDVSIAPGIRLNGISSARLNYKYYSNHNVTLNLVQDSVIEVIPEFGFSIDADFAWVEDFEGVGLKLISTTSSEADVDRTDNLMVAYEGQSAMLTLQEAQLKFECKSDNKYVLPGYGNPVILEFDYKSNNTLVVGTFITNPGYIVQEAIITLNPTEEWKRIYVSLIDQVSGNPNNLGIEPFFGFIRNEGLDGDANVYLDNIKLVY